MRIKKSLFKLLQYFLLCVSGSVALTQQSSDAFPSVTGGAQVIQQAGGIQTTVQTFYCPAPSDLIKNGLYWGTATSGWKSYSESFDTVVTSFIGAQWTGINVGKMVCLYKGALSTSFPIVIQNDTLAQTPVGGSWGADLGGRRNCHSTDVLQCPFVVKMQSVDINQIYQSLDSFKGKTDLNPRPAQ